MIAAAVASSRTASRSIHGRGSIDGVWRNSGIRPSVGHRFGTSGRHHSDSEPSWTVLLMMGAVSGGLLFAASWYLVSALVGSREEKGSAYTSAVDRWSETRRHFESLQVMATTSYESIVLRADTTPDSLHDAEDGLDLPVYEPLSYRAHGVPPGFFPAASFDTMHRDKASTMPVKSMHKSRLPRPREQEWGATVALALSLQDGYGEPVSLDIGTYPLVRAIVKHAPTPGPDVKCRRELSGLYRNGRCVVFSKLASICVQIALDADGRWVLARRDQHSNMSFGCDYFHGEWHVPKYYTVPASLAVGFVSFDNFTVEVRSSDDPYFTALELTNGSLDFGMTSGDDRAIGIVLLCLGLVMACPPGMAMYKCCCTDSSARSLGYLGHRDHSHRQDDFGGIGLGSYAGFEGSDVEMH